jgi:hypothetical protein
VPATSFIGFFDEDSSLPVRTACSQAFKDVATWGKEQVLSGRAKYKLYKH